MDFMRLETHFGNWYQIETLEGTDFVPCEDLEFDSHIGAYLRKRTLQGKEWESYPVEVTVLFDRWGARYSASGYLDCTPWYVGDHGQTEQQIMDTCRAECGEDEEP